jgi:lactate dehydrogenase-like 2-hydroxyacid dehydrogenase
VAQTHTHTPTHKHTQQGINVVMTPHIGGVTELSRDKMSKVFVDNVPAFFYNTHMHVIKDANSSNAHVHTLTWQEA